MKDICNCCEGIEPTTPLAIANRPGLDALRYRAGTHATFLETMLARLSSSQYPALHKLTARNPSDPAIALLDAWATVADVLTFYQERLANEGFLRTATERRSVLELANLVGYAPRPGVTASVYLAYTVDENTKDEVVIPQGARAQSVPDPGELPQTFETSEELRARREWNALKPRLGRPHNLNNPEDANKIDTLYTQGIDMNLHPNDLLLFVFGKEKDKLIHRRIEKVEHLHSEKLTKLELQDAQSSTPKQAKSQKSAIQSRIEQITKDTGSITSYVVPITLELDPEVVKDSIYPAWRNANLHPPSVPQVFAFRVTASLFGHNAPKRLKIANGVPEEIPDFPIEEEGDQIYLDGSYEGILSDSWVIVENGQETYIIAKVTSPQHKISRAAYGIVGKTTFFTLSDPADGNVLNWYTDKKSFLKLRKVVVHVQSEELTLADEPIPASEPVGAYDTIFLDTLVEGLEIGRRLIVSGEQVIKGTTGVMGSELAILAAVKQRVFKKRLDDKIQTELTLVNRLAHRYKRDTVTIYANVVKATHGETRTEVLGSGDGSKALQAFTLKQPPLTYVAAPVPSGVESTLQVRVNDLQWHAADTLTGLSTNDRSFIIKTDDDGQTTVIFGNGQQGARLPTGVENVRAEYRSGIGKAGNVKARQISLLMTRPLGVKEVINPRPASGGADKESRDQARVSAPLAVMALDRLVSVQDYADFARIYAGVGKASATQLSASRRELVYVTIAGADDSLVDKHSDLYHNLVQALRRHGDPHQPLQVEIRELLVLFIQAGVRVLPDHRWESVEPQIRCALLDTFSFERRELGQDVLYAEVVSTIQAVKGVDYVDLDVLDAASRDDTLAFLAQNKQPDLLAFLASERKKRSGLQEGQPQPRKRIPVHLARLDAKRADGIAPAQLAFLSPDVPDTLILKEIPA